MLIACRITLTHSTLQFASGACRLASQAARRNVVTLPRSTKPLDVPEIFSGIQPTGIPHLGNYLGALRPWVDLQNEPNQSSHRCFFSIVDLHALTLPQDPANLLRWRKESLVTLLAIGLDPEKSTIFFQSDVRLSGVLKKSY